MRHFDKATDHCLLGIAMGDQPYAGIGRLVDRCGSQGINPDRMSALVMAMGCALAAAGGALAGSLFNVSPAMGTPALIKGITILVLGGMGSLPGAIIGGLILGLVDGLVPIVFGAAWASILPLLLVIAVLLLRPQGIMGRESK